MNDQDKQKESGFKNEVASTPGGAYVLNCYLCGTCTAGCPINEIDDDFNPRKIMRMILLDQKEETLNSKEIWKCTQCHTCVSHCPQDVRFADIVRELRTMASEQGFADKDLPEKVEEASAESRKSFLSKIEELVG